MSITLIFKEKKRRRLGTGAPGVLVPPQEGKRGYFIPSMGALEQEEIDYMVEAQEEKSKSEKRMTQPRRVKIGSNKKNWEVEVTEE